VLLRICANARSSEGLVYIRCRSLGKAEGVRIHVCSAHSLVRFSFQTEQISLRSNRILNLSHLELCSSPSHRFSTPNRLSSVYIVLSTTLATTTTFAFFETRLFSGKKRTRQSRRKLNVSRSAVSSQKRIDLMTISAAWTQTQANNLLPHHHLPRTVAS
jgi:hypothetical protein